LSQPRLNSGFRNKPYFPLDASPPSAKVPDRNHAVYNKTQPKEFAMKNSTKAEDDN